ncbi:MAG: hypothetical protein R2813_03735 [Flavobacteriales bacterium]
MIVLFAYAPAKESLTTHITKRLLHRITVDSTVTHYWYTLERLASEEIPALIIALILFIVYRKNAVIQSIDAKWGRLFIVIGLAGTLPLMLTPIQKGFYMVPALAFFAIGIAMIIKPYAAKLEHRIARKRIVQSMTIVALLISIGLSGFSVGKTKRHESMLHDVYAIGKIVPPGTVIQVPRKIWDGWSLQTYFIRYFNISLDPYNQWEYYLCESNRTAPIGFDKVESDSQELTLYKRNSSIETKNQ